MSLENSFARTRQRGFTLLVAILLLLILTIFSLSALNVGVFEQRTSTNDFRAKVVHQVAEVGLNHASEAMRVMEDRILPDVGAAANAALWQLCNDDSFPCGAEADPARRARMYRYVGGVDLDGDGAVSTFEQRSLDFPLILEGAATKRLLQTTVPSADPANPFQVRYAVGALLCRVDTLANPGGGDASCTTSTARAGRLNAVTLVSRAEMVGEDASATISRQVVPIPRVAINPSVPAVTASGIITGLGSSTIVGNPDAGGEGVLISVWSRQDIAGGNGSWQTCHLDDWLRSSSLKLVDDEPVCDANGNGCGCPADAHVSGSRVSASGEGLDLLDVDGNTPGAYNGNTKGTLMDSPSFPCDLMEFVFGTRVREDTDGDGFCEDGTDSDGDGDNDAAVNFIRNELQATELPCSRVGELGPDSSGTYWIHASDSDFSDATGNMTTPGSAACRLPGTQIGRPSAPVILILDGGVNQQQGMEVFGLVFARHTATVDLPLNGGGASWSNGRGSAAVYGAVVVEGGGTINGNIDIIYNKRSLQGGNGSQNPVVGEIPGSWTDRYSY